MTVFLRRATMALFLLSTAPAWGGGTPYGANGLGLVVEDNAGRARGMGGAGVAAADGMSMIRGNPALLASFPRPVYGIGVLYNRAATATDRAGTLTYARTDPTLVRFVVPLRGKVALGWGIAPYTQANAQVELTGKPGDTFTDTMTSSGGINVSSFEAATKIRMISVGAALNYYFGSADEDWTRTFEDKTLVNTTDYVRKQYSGYGMTLGLLAQLPRNTTVGLGYTTPASVNMSVHVTPGTQEAPERLMEKHTVNVPAEWRLGIASQLSRRLSAAADVSFADWEGAARTDTEKMMYDNTFNFGAGVRFVPSTSPVARYLSTIPLSAGFRVGNRYYRSYPKVESIREAAITLGVELPFRDGAGGLVTSCEVGRRGNKDKNGWDETFFTVGVSLVGGIK